MSALTPHIEILPPSQRRVWERLDSTPREFVLYGGTALALRLGHRTSVDFDFFSRRDFAPTELLNAIDYLQNQEVVQQGENTLTCDVDAGEGPVKVSFFGGLSLRQLAPPDCCTRPGIAIASLRDLFGTKCATVPQRNEVKDYLDIHALIVNANIALTDGIACARAIYGSQYNAMMTLQALSYFDDLSDPLPESIKADLLAAVRSVALDKLPQVTAVGRIGDGVR